MEFQLLISFIISFLRNSAVSIILRTYPHATRILLL